MEISSEMLELLDTQEKIIQASLNTNTEESSVGEEDDNIFFDLYQLDNFIC